MPGAELLLEAVSDARTEPTAATGVVVVAAVVDELPNLKPAATGGLAGVLDEEPNGLFGSCFMPVVKSILVEAARANGDSGCSVCAYCAKVGSFTRIFLLATAGGGFVVAHGFVVAGGFLVARVGDVSSGKVSAGSIRLMLEGLVDGR